jgi:hypothetical protein
MHDNSSNSPDLTVATAPASQGAFGRSSSSLFKKLRVWTRDIRKIEDNDQGTGAGRMLGGVAVGLVAAAGAVSAVLTGGFAGFAIGASLAVFGFLLPVAHSAYRQEHGSERVKKIFDDADLAKSLTGAYYPHIKRQTLLMGAKSDVSVIRNTQILIDRLTEKFQRTAALPAAIEKKLAPYLADAEEAASRVSNFKQALNSKGGIIVNEEKDTIVLLRTVFNANGKAERQPLHVLKTAPVAAEYPERTLKHQGYYNTDGGTYSPSRDKNPEPFDITNPAAAVFYHPPVF